MSEPIIGTSLTTVVEFNETALALSNLRERYKGLVVDVQTPKGLKEAKTFTFELRTLRTTLEKRRKDLKAPIIERGKQLDDEAKRITAEIVALEEPIDVQIKAEEARIENARLQKLEAERLRVEAIQQKIQSIRDVPASLVGKPSVIIAGQLAKLRETVLDEAELGEYYVMATDALTAATARVEQLLAAQHEAEAEKKRQAERDAEMEAMRVKMAEQQRLIDEAEEAKRVEQERLEQVERDRVAVEEAAERATEQARLDEIARVERERREEADRIEREEQDRIRAEQEAALQAERERQAAEQKKLDEQAAQLKRDQQVAAAKAEADRLANLGLREAAYAVLNWSIANLHEGEQVFLDLSIALANDAAQAKPSRVKRGAK